MSGAFTAPAAQSSHASMCRSVPQMPVRNTRIFTSPGPASGSGRSTNSRPGCAAGLYNAFISSTLPHRRHGRRDHSTKGRVNSEERRRLPARWAALTPESSTNAGSASDGVAEQRVHELLGIEWGQVVRPYAQPDELHRDIQLPLDGDDDPALGRAVQLGEHNAGDVDDFGEDPGLDHAVLPGRGVQDEQRLVHRTLPFDNALDLAQ